MVAVALKTYDSLKKAFMGSGWRTMSVVEDGVNPFSVQFVLRGVSAEGIGK